MTVPHAKEGDLPMTLVAESYQAREVSLRLVNVANEKPSDVFGCGEVGE